MTNREQAIRDVAAATLSTASDVERRLSDGDYYPLTVYAVAQREKVLELLAALKGLLDTHCCDTGEPDYKNEWDGDHTVCEVCKPAWKVLQQKEGERV